MEKKDNPLMDWERVGASPALKDALARVLPSYAQYYSIMQEPEESPFAARAYFDAHGEEYFLIRQAKVAEIDSRELVYFALCETLMPEGAKALAESAWNRGMEEVRPGPNHRCTDVLLIVLAEHLPEETAKAISTIAYYKSYRMTLWGWSHFKMAVYEVSGGGLACNRQGKDLGKLMHRIFQSS